jgi:hypothetical protein
MKIAPVRLEILLNGRRLATTGIERFGVLSTMLTWCRRNPSSVTGGMRAEDGFDESRFLREVCELEFGGLDSVADRTSSGGKERLRPGDEVTIRVLPQGEYDTPRSGD